MSLETNTENAIKVAVKSSVGASKAWQNSCLQIQGCPIEKVVSSTFGICS